MFYSQLLLSKKGALGIVWMAAHCHKRLKKVQVQQTSVPSSVDTILDAEVPVVTHRILAFLLLGVVRIYSKKVEYLFHDSYEVLNKLHGFRIERRKQACTKVSQTHYHSIIFPKSFELDAFDLEQSESEDFMCGEVRTDESIIMLEDGSEKDALISKAIVPFSEASSMDCTPTKDVDRDLLVCESTTIKGSLLSGTSLYLEDRLDPMMLDEAEEDQLCYKGCGDATRACSPVLKMEPDSVASLSNKISHSAPSLEILRESRCLSEGVLDFMALDEPEILQTDNRSSTDNVMVNFLVPIQDEEFCSVARPSHQVRDLVPSSGVHQSGFTYVSIPEIANVQTPGLKECTKILKKRKILFDQTTILANSTLKNWIEEDPSDLKRERRKVPLTVLHVWRAGKYGHVSRNLLNPLVSGMSMELSSLVYKGTCPATELSPSQHEVRSPVTDDALVVDKQTTSFGSSVPQIYLEQTPIAPGTPVTTHSNKARTTMDPIISSAITEKRLLLREEKELNWVLHDHEETSWVGEDSIAKDARARMRLSDLRRKFLEKRRNDEEAVLNLSQLLQGKTQRESAQVLKTGDFIHVEQRNAYEEILLSPSLSPNHHPISSWLRDPRSDFVLPGPFPPE
ncbi:uncharacterized protein LOC127244125 isoform X3 [Andrographis paniculata]|uniref:uncharacterized protein LOC127244125 isoform X3 n=1 Tax=Andrographis paniculata TaxID=175694 RepID=UPI0021E6F1C4|nr:uncharacterized protein LOC127244125 isoform X3 [Andrographis paniculata]